MKKTLIMSIIMSLFAFTSCDSNTQLVSVQSQEKSDIINEEESEKTSADITDINNEEDKVEEEQDKPKEYFGQALSSSAKNGSVKVYAKADSKSKVICKVKDLEMVKLIETVPYGWFKVQIDENKIGYMDARKVRTKEIPPHEYSKDDPGYNLIFTHKDQKLKIYKDGELVKECLGSSGIWDKFTPKGIFEVEKGRRGSWAYIERFDMGFKYWVGFKHIYLFHSVPYNSKKQLLKEEEAKLGQPASHGCIRLPVDVAKYIYDNVPEGSKVLIY